MHIEFSCLAIITILFLLAWIPASIGKLQTFGGKWLSSNRVPLPGKQLEGWAGRCDRAHQNLKEFIPGFIVAILLLGLTQKFSQATSIASIIYVVSRIGHFISYSLGFVNMRAISFFAGLFSNIYLLICIFV